MSTSDPVPYRHLLCIAVLAALFYGAAANAQSAGATGYGYGMGASAAINSTASYVNSINQSSYLIFYPNLTGAYNYLNMARNESQTNLTYTYLLLGKARASAQVQQQILLKYQQLSLLIIIVLAVFLAALLYFFMRPRSRKGSKVRHLSK
ncbi:MAG: hypothetical protein ABSE71_01130 [Candidatus Micrarchaeaceae archaeon]|jgi:hypothetical protein|nr:hypothetical protein [Candidatus Micrarchaeota archaeon]HII09884.1 hypothetical protein [Candidatus Micrarchaeota archaeon]